MEYDRVSCRDRGRVRPSVIRNFSPFVRFPLSLVIVRETWCPRYPLSKADLLYSTLEVDRRARKWNR